MENYFVVKLWEDVIKLITSGEGDSGKFLLYKSLYEERIATNFFNCNDFLEYTMFKEMDSTLIVLILNVLSPSKDIFPSWDKYVEESTKKLLLIHNQDYVNDLLKVIV